MVTVDNPLVVRLFINTAMNGWSERWPIIAQDWPTGLAVAAVLAAARSRVLCSNASLVWASLATIVPPYVEQAILPAPLLPLPQWGPNAGDMEGILFNFSSQAGYYQPRLLRAVDTTEYQAGKWIRRYLPLPSIVTPLPADLSTATKDQLWQNTLGTFCQYVGLDRPQDEGQYGPTSFLLGGYDTVSYNQIRSRRVGALYRRASWESMARSTAPAFSPCGTAVTVLRRCYQEPCRFYVNQQTTGIRYYWTPPGAGVLPIPTVFYGWSRAKENLYHGGPGETAQYKRAFETDGNAFSTASGTSYTGTPQDFLGNGIVSWYPYIPTPPSLRPVCDEPPAQVSAGPGGLAWGGFWDGEEIPAGDSYFGVDYWPGDYFGKWYFP